MELPFFYIESVDSNAGILILGEENSKHIVQVLRMKKGEQLKLTDGKGSLLIGEIIDEHKKHCTVRIVSTSSQQPAPRNISVGLSLIKNASRFEWFLEKATEIGVSTIFPLLCTRTEKERFRQDRMQAILVSAMLQSQQCWLPVLHEPTEFYDIVNQSNHQQKFIAHCMNEEKKNLPRPVDGSTGSQIVLIGPEGDFTKEEIDFALQYHFHAITLGKTRLRSETAAMVAATLLCIG